MQQRPDAPYNWNLRVGLTREEIEKEIPSVFPHPSELTVDERDVDTPDHWVKRHKNMLRLTGIHPYNVEVPPTWLLRSFITPVSIHYTRNHGSVPRLGWDHAIDFTINRRDGTVRKLKLAVKDLIKLPTISFPVTLTCAGNRRKEENMTKSTIGFSWVSSATSCTEWTGVRLSTVLKLAGLDWNDEEENRKVLENRYVTMTGSDELPKGKYCTCVHLGYAMDPANDVIVAFKQNGEFLEPDRGFPVRMIIPGYIGGRSVKWLQSIEVQEGEPDAYYHQFDNRIIPPLVDKDLADKENWWAKPEYKFNELNINSAIVFPAHGELIKVNDLSKMTEIAGYAYSGGGHRITRVEVSLNEGNTWELAQLKVTEIPNKYSKYWCWIFWSFQVPMSRLVNSSTRSICVRAWDQSNNVQPRDLTWNVMGMGQNSWFKVRLEPTKVGDSYGIICVHPTYEEGLKNPTGWMPVDLNGTNGNGGRKPLDDFTLGGNPKPAIKPAAEASQNAGKASSSSSSTSTTVAATGKLYSMEEVKKHDLKNGCKTCWIVVKNNVYDITKFVDEHPGGKSIILMNAGKDVTAQFEMIHSEKAWRVLAPYIIGQVQPSPKL